MAGELTAIVGTGSLAAAAGWALNQIGQPFYFINRLGPTAWNYSFDDGSSTRDIARKVPAVWSTNTGLMLVCVKAYDLPAAFSHAALFQQQLAVVPLANGAIGDLIMTNSKKFPAHLFRTGFATVGCTRSGLNEFSSRSTSGRFHFGPASAGSVKTSIEDRITRPGSMFVWSDAIVLYQRRKWLFNTVINSITAARRLASNGQVLEDLSYLSAVFAEAFSLSVELYGAWPVTRQELYESMIKLIKDTEHNENSMAGDIRLGRKTESDYLAGLALKAPDKYPLLVSLHQSIVGG